MPASLKKDVKDFWSKYIKVSPKWAWYYAQKNGIKDPRYIPNTMYYTKIDQHFNNRKVGYGFNDKNYYSVIFSDVKQPLTIAKNIDGIFVDETFNLISVDSVLNRIKEEQNVICKPSMESGSGRGIMFWNYEKDNEKIKQYLSTKSEKNYIIQALIKQHDDLNKVHASSINTLRIVSLLMQDGVYILSSVLRMGVGDSKVDNATAGGLSCGIKEDGTLKEYATTYYSGDRFDRHPQGLVFKDFKVPAYDKAVSLVKRIHPIIPHFRLVAWDLAVDNEGDVVLVESNMRKGGINLCQFNNGPLFGDMTEKVLDEVFGKQP